MIRNLMAETKLLGGNTKGIFFIVFFRFSSYLSRSSAGRFFGLPFRVLYRLLVQWILGIDVPDTTNIGSGLKLFHGQGLIVNSETVIGKNVTLRHNTTIGAAREGGGAPKIGNNVDIGANSVIIGAVLVGDDAVIGAGSVVVRDVPPGAVVVGNPAYVLKVRK